MGIAIPILGVVLVLAGVVFPFWRIATVQGTVGHAGLITTSSLLAIFAGVTLILMDRITELTLPGVGTIRAVTDQVVTDAKTVADLKVRVENQSATVDLVAAQAIKAQQVSEVVANQTKDAAQKLEKLNASIKDAEAALANLQEDEEFMMIVISAQNDDRSSFEKLKELANKKDNRFSELSSRIWTTIFEIHSSPIAQSGFTVPWARGIDPSKLSLQDLTQDYQLAPAQIKPGLLEYIWKRADTKNRPPRFHDGDHEGRF